MIQRLFVALLALGLALGPTAMAAQVTKEVMAQPDGRALCLDISPDSKTLAAGCTDRSIRLLDSVTGEKRVVLTGVTRGYVRRVAFTPDGRTVAGIGDDNQLRLWDSASGKMRKRLPALSDGEPGGFPGTRPNSLAISPDGGLIAVGGGDTKIQVRDAKTGELVWSQVGRNGYMRQLAFSCDGQTLASATGREVKLWDARSGDLKQTLKPRAGGWVWALALSPDNRHLAGYGTGVVEEKRASWLTLWDLRSGAIVHTIDAGEADDVATSGTLAFSPDGKSVASASVGIAAGRISVGGGPVFLGQKVINNVKLWDVATGAPKWTSPEGDVGQVKSLVYSPDGEWLYCCDDSAISRIDARTGQTRQDLMKPKDGRPR